MGPILSTAAPVSIGTSITGSKPVVAQLKDGVVVTGREFADSVNEYNQSSTWQIGSLIPIHPAYFVGSTLGNIARTYELYRFRSLVFHFVSRQPTSVTGEIMLVSSRTALEPCEDGSSGNFLPRAMSRGRSVLGPLWQNHSIEIECDATWRLVDAFINADYDDNVLGELQAYTLAAVADTAGYIIMDYVVEFKTTMYQPHSSLIPISSGVGQSVTLVDSSTTPTANAIAQYTNATVDAPRSGTIWRFVLNLASSTLATGTTAANALMVGTASWATSSTIANSNTNFTLLNGTQLYLAVTGSSIYAFASYESAQNGDGSGAVFYRTTGSTAASLVGQAYLLRIGNADMLVTS